MNRKNELEAMIEELNRCAPGLETTLDRAYRKKRKRTAKMIVRPVAGLAACFLIFVLLVNFSAPVAYACSKIPVLRELAAAVTFSQSLTDAVENEYVQTIDLTQTENDITAEIAYLIVDQKQVNIFYRLDSDKYEKLVVDLIIENIDDWNYTESRAENGELRCLSIDFYGDNVPDSLAIRLLVLLDMIDYENMAPENSVDDVFSEEVADDSNILADFEFLLEFDPSFTAAGKVFPLNQTVILDDQAITITDIEVYPSYTIVNLQQSEENTAWLKGVDFYIETDEGIKFDLVDWGMTSTEYAVSHPMFSYRTESTYFYDTEHLKLVITGATWLRKGMETIYLNLVTGEHGELPEGIAFDSAERSGNDWIVTFHSDLDEDDPMPFPFEFRFYDANGNEYRLDQLSTVFGIPVEPDDNGPWHHKWSNLFGNADEEEHFNYFYQIENYPHDEVWLCPRYSHDWVAEDPTVITVNCESADTEVKQ